MIAFFMQMLEFDQLTTRFVDGALDIIYDVIKFNSIFFILRRPAVANFANSIKINIILTKSTFNVPIKAKRIRKNCLLPDMKKIATFSSCYNEIY